MNTQTCVMKIYPSSTGYHIDVYDRESIGFSEDFLYDGPQTPQEVVKQICYEYNVPPFAISVVGKDNKWNEYFTQEFIPQYRYQEFTINEPNDIFRLPDFLSKHVQVLCDKSGFVLKTWCDQFGKYGQTIRFRPAAGEYDIVNEPYWKE